MRSLLTCGFLLLVMDSARAQAPPSAVATSAWNQWTVELAAGGGFAGIPEVQVQTEPNFTCGTSGTCVALPSTIVLVKNRTYTWRPSLSTGLVFFRRFTPDQDAIGFGIGGHFVFVPRGDSATAAPALTAHLGKTGTHLFFGAIWAPSDDATLPGGGDRAIVPAGTDPKQFLRANASGRTPTFFAGVVIGGVAISKPPSSGPP